MLNPSGRGFKLESADRLRLIDAFVEGDTAFLLGYQRFYDYIRPGIFKMPPDTNLLIYLFYGGEGFNAEIEGGALTRPTFYLT